ncbi:MAG: hypothetical protein K8T89_21135, partial [Planctomycetes bacterium]|nr:hypothetical protein [Planctomycetota bacterium]
ELADAQNVRFAIDLHCPFLRGDVHEAFYFDGLTIPHINDNVNELIAWIKEERPPATSWPLNFMKKPPMIAPENGMPCSHYFAYKKDVILATTLEVPFTQPNCPLDAAMARQYGVALLRAFLRTKFVSEDRKVTGGTTDSEELRTLRSAYQPLYRGKPEEARKLVDALVKNAPPDSVYRVERVNLLGLIHLHQKQFSAAWFCFVLVLGDEHATTQQRATAATQVLAIAFSDPASTPAYIDNALAEFNRFPYPSAEQLLRVYNLSADYFQAQKNYARALRNIELLYPIALSYEKGKTLNRMAALYDLLKQPEMALASRKEAVALLRKQLDPMPVGVSGPLMANDLFEALQGIPSATLQEKKEAAEMVLNHKVTPVALKEKVRKALAELEKK